MTQTEVRSAISAVSQAKPCVVTTAEDHSFVTGDFVRITDLNGMVPVDRGMPEINRNRFQVQKLTDTTLALLDPLTDAEIDSSGYTAYVEGGSINKITQTFQYEAN